MQELIYLANPCFFPAYATLFELVAQAIFHQFRFYYQSLSNSLLQLLYDSYQLCQNKAYYCEDKMVLNDVIWQQNGNNGMQVSNNICMNKSRCSFDEQSDRRESVDSSLTKRSTVSNTWSGRRQYLSLKKHRSIHSSTVYTSTSPVRGRGKEERCSLSPDRKSLYWQNWLLPEGARKPISHDKPTVSAQSFCALLADNNEVLQSENCHQPRQIASLTKIMTAFTVINICNTHGLKIRDVPIVIHSEAAMMEGTTANLRPGDELFVIDLLYGLMLPSGNDAAVALAQYFGKFLSYTFANENQQLAKEGDQSIGKFQEMAQFYEAEYQQESVKLFLFEMNKNAHKMGLKQTRFSNPTGLSDSSNYSTAFEIAQMTSYCLKNHMLRTIVKKKSYICEAKNQKLATVRQIEWRNTNAHLFKFRDCTGVKTGITPSAGPCLCSSYRIMGRELIVVLLKSDSMDHRFQDAERLYRYARSKLHSST